MTDHVAARAAPIKPRIWISRITVDPKDSDSVFVTFSGYRAGENSPYVLHSGNGGKTWTDISANLPKAPVTDLDVIKGQLYVSTDVGVFTSTLKNPSWTPPC